MTKASSRLLYKRPAKNWNEALPIGNGTLGGMVFGRVKEEKISLNHDELWSGYPKEYDDSGRSKCFKLAREYVINGDFENATEIIENDFLSGVTQAYMPLGDILIKYNDIDAAKNYRRSLNLSTAVANVEFEASNTKYTREVFASCPDKHIALKLTADGEKRLCLSISFESQLHSICTTDGNKIYLSGECPSDTQHNGKDMPKVYYCEDERRGIQFLAGAAVHTDGIITDNLQSLEISDATTVLIYLTAETSFNGYNKHPYLQGKEYKKPCIERLSRFDAASYDTIKGKHILDYKNIYDRVSFDLGNGRFENTSTEYRLKRFQNKKDDIELCVLFYNFGRYLAIASSRKGSQPSNLQGIWNNNVLPPWNSNYTININTEMNYWPVLMCSMPEIASPLVEMVRELSIAGEKTAKDFYDAPGFVCHHNTDLWRFTRPVGLGNASWGFWSLSSGWFCHHLFEIYDYSHDIDFLKDTAYPIMIKAAEFYNHLLIKDKDGFYIFAPSTSPENMFKIGDKRFAISPTSTMSMSIIKELFINCIKASKILDIENEFLRQIKEKLDNLLPLRIGSKNQLLEWYDEVEEHEVHHRHISHLYGLYPANEIDVDITPELAQAAKKSLEIRGDEGTGWSLGWKINFWARLRDGDHALKLLERQLRYTPCNINRISIVTGGGTYANLFDAHPPFQIDGNFGALSGITQMLMQSYENRIILLPALPSKWAQGSIKGLTAKGNIKVDISWKNGRLVDYNLSGNTENIIVIYNGNVLDK